MSNTREERDRLAVQQVKDVQRANPWPGIPAAGERPERSTLSNSGIADQQGGSPSNAGRPASEGAVGVPGQGTGERLGGHTDRPARMPPIPRNDPSGGSES